MYDFTLVPSIFVSLLILLRHFPPLQTSPPCTGPHLCASSFVPSLEALFVIWTENGASLEVIAWEMVELSSISLVANAITWEVISPDTVTWSSSFLVKATLTTMRHWDIPYKTHCQLNQHSNRFGPQLTKKTGRPQAITSSRLRPPYVYIC